MSRFPSSCEKSYKTRLHYEIWKDKSSNSHLTLKSSGDEPRAHRSPWFSREIRSCLSLRANVSSPGILWKAVRQLTKINPNILRHGHYQLSYGDSQQVASWICTSIPSRLVTPSTIVRTSGPNSRSKSSRAGASVSFYHIMQNHRQL